MWLVIVLLLHSATFLCGMNISEKQRITPQYMAERAIDPRNNRVKQKIVLYHNFFRTKVSPTATNMLKMSWHDGAASQAQAYAEQCIFLQHNDNSERVDSKLGTCGQNLYASSDKRPWFEVLKNWFIEYKDFTYGSPEEPVDVMVGHYRQMVWATSHKVGCGLAKCEGGLWGHFYNYVCHYCPGGNIYGITNFPYKSGPSCKDCPQNCIAGSLCTNACRYIDFYNNCKDLLQYSGTCNSGNCNATCICGETSLHKNHPW